MNVGSGRENKDLDTENLNTKGPLAAAGVVPGRRMEQEKKTNYRSTFNDSPESNKFSENEDQDEK